MYECPTSGVATPLGPTADSLEEVQFRALTVESCGSCQQKHTLEKTDLFLGDEAPDE